MRRSIFANTIGAEVCRHRRATFVRAVGLVGLAHGTVGAHYDVVGDIGFPCH